MDTVGQKCLIGTNLGGKIHNKVVGRMAIAISTYSRQGTPQHCNRKGTKIPVAFSHHQTFPFPPACCAVIFSSPSLSLSVAVGGGGVVDPSRSFASAGTPHAKQHHMHASFSSSPSLFRRRTAQPTALCNVYSLPM